jgi:hypothetical protein
VRRGRRREGTDLNLLMLKAIMASEALGSHTSFSRKTLRL